MGHSSNSGSSESSRADEISETSWNTEQLLVDLYDLSRTPECWQQFLARICVGLEAFVGVIVKRDAGHADEQVVATYALGAIAQARLREACKKNSSAGDGALPVLPSSGNGSHGGASISSIDLDRSGCDCVLRTLGVGHLLYACKSGEPQSVSLAVGRMLDQPPFDEIEQSRFANIAPHFEWAFQLAELFAKLTANVNASTAVLDLLPTGVIILDEQGTCVTMNRAARETLDADGSALRLIKRNLPRTNGPDHGTENGRNGPQILSLPSRTAGQRSVAVLWDVPDGKSEQQRKFAFIMDPDHQRSMEIDVAALEQIYGLTAAEARVAALVAESKSVAEIAEQMGNTAHTIRTHLRHIFEKTGTERQVDLVHLLLQSPLALRQPRRTGTGSSRAPHGPEGHG